MKYWPNPAHKKDTSEAGPPRWRPSKTQCPPMTIEERDDLLRRSAPEDPSSPTARRFAMRRTAGLEWFAAVFTEFRDGEPVFHGYPTRSVPARVLRAFRDAGSITDAEYRRAIKELG